LNCNQKVGIESGIVPVQNNARSAILKTKIF